MRRVIIVGLAALALAPAAEAAPGFRYGVAAGEMTSTSALLWTRSNELGQVRLFVWPAPRKGMPPVQITLAPSNERDRVVQRRVHGLKPGTRYTYLFSTPYRKSEIAAGGTFWTAPAPRSGATVRFAISGDADGARDPKTGKPAYNAFQVYGRMAAERNHFNINLGDTIYSDSEVGGVPPALTIPAKWAKYKQNLGFGHLRNLRRGTGLYSHWDDHEFINDFSRPEHGAGIFTRGAIAFRDYSPVTYSPAAWALSHVPLGQASRALLPRRARLPLREGADDLQRRPRADGAAARTRRVRGARAVAREPGAAGVPRRAGRSVADDARRGASTPPSPRRSRHRLRPGR